MSTHPPKPATPAPATPGIDPARPHLDERADYVPRAAPERFIVPLLAREIGSRLRGSMPAVSPGDRALDVGCGRQPFRRELERAGLRYVGLDTQQNADCPVDVVAAIDRPAPPELLALAPFRFILCTEVLEHVADWEGAFENFGRLLGPGGRVLITAPHVYPLHEVPYDFWRPTTFALEYFARRHGLRVVEAARLGTGWDVLGTVLASVMPSARPGVAGSRLAAGAFKVVRRLVLGPMERGWPQRLMDLGGNVYQSNLAVLEKPGGAA